MLENLELIIFDEPTTALDIKKYPVFYQKKALRLRLAGRARAGRIYNKAPFVGAMRLEAISGTTQ